MKPDPTTTPPRRPRKSHDLRKSASYKAGITPLQILVASASFEMELARKKGLVR